MATPRKKGAVKSRSKKPVTTKKRLVAKSAKPAARKPAKPVKRVAMPAPKPVQKVVAAKLVKPGSPAAKLKPARPGFVPKPKSKSSSRKRAPGTPEEVRPIGMLPPESVARTTHRPAPKGSASYRVPLQAAVRPAPVENAPARQVTEEEYKEFEDRLLQERRRILKEMGHLESTVLKVNQRDSSGDLSGYSFHMADAGTDAMEREKAFLFASAEGRVLLQIDDALRRLYRGEYGICESCSKPIARARLEVMPQARLCVSCKEKEERSQRGAV
jgi:RNA polymerase-binding transcription factor DksA